MATTPPTLTPLVGVPSNIPTSKLGTITGVASYDGPYIGGPTGLGLGQVPFKYDTTSGGYVTMDSPAVAFALPVARGDVLGSVAPTGWLLIDLTWQGMDGKYQNDRITLRPQAGPGAVLDLSVSQAPLAYTTPQSLLDLIALMQGVTTAGNTAITNANTAAGNANAVAAAVPGQVTTALAPIAQALADSAQVLAAVQIAADTTITNLTQISVFDPITGYNKLYFQLTRPVLPAAPSNLIISSESTSAVSLAWTDNANNETGYAVQWSTDGVSWPDLTTLPAGTVTYTDTLSADMTRLYRVAALKGNFRSDPSNTVTHSQAYPNSLYAAYRLSGDTITAVADRSGNARNGTGAGTGVTKVATGLQFSATGGRIDFGNTGAVGANGLYICIALRTPAAIPGSLVAPLGRFNASNNVSSQYVLYIASGNGRAAIIAAIAASTTNLIFQSANSVCDGGWHFIEFFLQSGANRFWVDGVDNSTSTGNLPASAIYTAGTFSNFTLGGTVNGYTYSDIIGSVHELARLPTDAERQMIRTTERNRLNPLGATLANV